MMFGVTALLMIHRWAQQEERAALRFQASGAALPSRAVFLASRRAANRRMALGLVAFAATVLTITFTIVLVYHYSGTRVGAMYF